MKSRARIIFIVGALLPTLAVYAWVRLYPIADVLWLSLHEWNLISKVRPFIGLENFVELSSDPLFLEALRNTTVIAFGVLLVTIPLPWYWPR